MPEETVFAPGNQMPGIVRAQQWQQEFTMQLNSTLLHKAIGIFSAVAAATMLAVAPVVAAEPTTLEISYSNSAYGALLDELSRAFGADHPDIKIVYRPPPAATEELLAQLLRARITGELPDLVFAGYQQVSVLAERGLPVALNSLMASELDWSELGYTKASLSATEVDGKYYGLPFEGAVPIVFYNADLVRQAGEDPENLPKQWPEIIALAKKINAQGNGVMGGFFDYLSSGNWTFQALITSQGGRMMEPGTKAIAFNGPTGRNALEVIQQFGETGMVDMTQQQALQAFGAGKIGVMPSFSSALNQLEKQAEGKFTVRTAPWPLPSSGGRIPIGGRTIMLLTRDPERQKAAWEYAKFATGPVGQTLLAKMTSSSPVNMIAIETADLLGDFYKAHPNHMVAIQALPVITGWFSFPGENSVKISDGIRDDLRRVAVGETTPAEALAKIDSDVKALLP